jgi:hypothetical protein
MFETIKPKRGRLRYNQIRDKVRYEAEERRKKRLHEKWLRMRGVATLVMIKKAFGAALLPEEQEADMTFFAYDGQDPVAWTQRAVRYMSAEYRNEILDSVLPDDVLFDLSGWLNRRYHLIVQIETGVTNYYAPWNCSHHDYGIDRTLVKATHGDSRKWCLFKDAPVIEDPDQPVVREEYSCWERFVRFMAGKNYR